VRFAAEPKVDILAAQLTKEEYQATWYNPKDFLEFKRLNRCTGKTIRERRSLFENFSEMMLDPLAAEDFESHLDEDVSRGIEHFCCALYFEERKLRKQRTVQAVLIEQKKQQDAKIHDPEAIADVERTLSRRTKELALRFGHLDASAVDGGLKLRIREQCAKLSGWYLFRRNATCTLRRPLSPTGCAELI